jgi:hypothetical protein
MMKSRQVIATMPAFFTHEYLVSPLKNIHLIKIHRKAEVV